MRLPFSRHFPRHSLWVTACLCGAALSPVLAHDVQIADDVGATLHIEPNDIARAGEPADLWFALTQAGGKIIPLADCDCTLTLYDSQATAISTPPLTPVSAEGFQDIPGATVTFPEVGAYELVLNGGPQSAESFSDFELRFEVTVASRGGGATPSPSTTEERAPNAATAAGEQEPVGTPEATSDDAGTDNPTAVAPTAETPAPTSTSILGMAALILGGAVVVVGLAIAIMGGRRSPGGKE